MSNFRKVVASVVAAGAVAVCAYCPAVSAVVGKAAMLCMRNH